MIRISASGLPVIDRAGQFPLLNPVFDFLYRNPTHALHVYGYAAKIRINDRVFDIKPGDITCIQGGTTYSLYSNSPGKHWCIHFYDDLIDKDISVDLPSHLHLGASSIHYLEQIRTIARLFNSYSQHDNLLELNRLQARFRLKALLLMINECCFHKQSGGSRRTSNYSWAALLEWIDDNLSHPISISTLAERANVAPTTLSNKFKHTYNTTLIQYLQRRRIDRAKNLLIETPMTIFEVGLAVGISDPQYFNKQFRKYTGMSPTHYRAENKCLQNTVTDDLATRGGTWHQRRKQ